MYHLAGRMCRPFLLIASGELQGKQNLFQSKGKHDWCMLSVAIFQRTHALFLLYGHLHSWFNFFFNIFI